MPLPSLLNNPGPLLVSKVRGGTDAFPKEFLAKIGLDIHVQNVPNDIEPSTLTALLVESSVVAERTDERKKTDKYFSGPVTTELVTEVLLPDGQIGTETRSLVPEGTDLTADALTEKATQNNLGNGWLDQIVITKPTVFAKRVRSTELPDLVPVEFRAFLKNHHSEDTLAGGIADPPVLGSNEFIRREEELDVFTFRRITQSRDAVSLPFTITGNKRTNRYKQVETITHTLEVDTTTPTAPSSTRDVTFTKLGNGLAVEEKVEVPVIFDATVAATELANIIPIEFRAALPIYTLESTTAGTVTIPPVLATGELSRKEEQVDAFNFRRTITSLGGTVTFPQTLSGTEVTSEFGGGILDFIRTLDDSAVPVDTGTDVVSSVSRQIGPSLFHNETRRLQSPGVWPTLVNWKFDEESQSFIKEETQVIDPTGYTPVTGSNWFENLKAIDKWKSQRIRTTKASLPGSGSPIVSYEYRPYQFPGWLCQVIGGYYVRKSHADLCRHKIKTWWQTSATVPTVDEIIMDNPIISSLNSTTTKEYAGECLHDDLTTFSSFYYPATTPSGSLYAFGTASGTSIIYILSITSGGAGYAVGNIVSLGGHSWTVLTVDGTGAILSVSVPTPPSQVALSLVAGTAGTLTGGSPSTAATGTVLAATYQTFTPGTAWIGQEKVISAKVTPTDIPGIWKCQTESVVMR